MTIIKLFQEKEIRDVKKESEHCDLRVFQPFFLLINTNINHQHTTISTFLFHNTVSLSLSLLRHNLFLSYDSLVLLSFKEEEDGNKIVEGRNQCTCNA